MKRNVELENPKFLQFELTVRCKIFSQNRVRDTQTLRKVYNINIKTCTEINELSLAVGRSLMEFVWSFTRTANKSH